MLQYLVRVDDVKRTFGQRIVKEIADPELHIAAVRLVARKLDDIVGNVNAKHAPILSDKFAELGGDGARAAADVEHLRSRNEIGTQILR